VPRFASASAASPAGEYWTDFYHDRICMSEQPKRFFDLWFVAADNVITEVPFHVVTDWIIQGRAVLDDRIRPAGTVDWWILGTIPAFEPYFPKPEPRQSIPPVEMEPEWRSATEDEDDDVDMIPLIDISLVLLIFFMMTMTVASISRIKVPDSREAHSLESSVTTLRIDIDLRDGKRIFSIGSGTGGPAPEDDNMSSDVELLTKLDEKLKDYTAPPKVRIAAHGDLPFEVVEEVLKGLERRRKRDQISEYAVEVNERAKP
jgi:biopolymer transport protein ExbD